MTELVHARLRSAVEVWAPHPIRLRTSFDKFDSSVPRLEMAVSWPSSAVNCVFQGVSTFCRLPTIWATVELTSNPAPLVGDPKFSPTTPPIALSLKKLKQPGNQPPPDWVGSLL
jgi:hypothetical protein